MIALQCQCERFVKNGKSRKGEQRFKCKDCGRRWTEEQDKPIGDMRIDLDRAALAIQLLVEGTSVRAASRISGLAQDTISKLILIVGDKCEKFLAKTIKGVQCSYVEADEVWSFVGCKERTRKSLGYGPEMGDSWTFVAIDRESKLVLAHHIADRSLDASYDFLTKLANATTGEFQLTTDGWHGYTNAVPMTLGRRVHFAQLIKNYESEQETVRYSPAKIKSIEKVVRFGSPDPAMISTSFVENWNLQLRMSSRRHTRLTNAFSKSRQHHVAMQHIFVAAYNFCRKHGTLKKSPAMAAGLADSVWTIKTLLAWAGS